MAALVDYFTGALGAPLLSTAGGRRFGKHSWRATGAVYLSSLQLELFKIQLMARWSSPIIMRYARSASLQGLTAHVADLQSGSSLAKTLKGLQSRVDEVDAKLAALDVHTANHLRQELASASRCGGHLSDRVQEEGYRFVVNTVTSKCHGILTHLGFPTKHWETKCGWKFGFAPHMVVTQPLDDRALSCSRCHPANL